MAHLSLEISNASTFIRKRTKPNKTTITYFKTVSKNSKYDKITRSAIRFIFCLSLFGCQSNGQSPDAVKEAFKSKYPGENDPDWEKDKNGNFESSFKIDGIHCRADFSPSGEWVVTEQSIKKKELPKAIQKKSEENHTEYEIVELEKVNHP